MTKTSFRLLAPSIAALASLSATAFATPIDLTTLQRHLSWCLKSHTAAAGQQGVVTFQPNSAIFREAADLRYDFAQCQAHNTEASALIAEATDFELISALDSAIYEVETYVAKHMRWVAYDRLRAAELLVAQESGDAASIRAIYIFEQGSNPEARSNLKAVSDLFLIRLVGTL